MDTKRSKFAKRFAQIQTSSTNLLRTQSISTNDLVETEMELSSEKKYSSLDRMEIDYRKTVFQNKSNGRHIFSTLQPDIYASLDSSSSENEYQSNSSNSHLIQQDLINIKKELILRTNTVTTGFEIFEEIYTKSLISFHDETSKMGTIERIFKDLRCMKNFHQLYQNELSSVITKDLPLSTVFTNHVINSSLNWYKIFYTTFETRNHLLASFYQQDCQFKAIVNRVIVNYSQQYPDLNLINLHWILSSIKDSLFHFQVLLTRYSECVDNNAEKVGINEAVQLIENILRSCNMQCDYNDFIKTQQEYSLLSAAEPLSPSVRFVHKGLVQKVCRNGSHIRQRMIFLFTHKIFITSKSLHFQTYKIRKDIQLSLCNFSILNLEMRKGFSLQYETFVCEFFIEKDIDFYTWIEKLNSTISNAKQRKNSFEIKFNKFLNKSDDDHQGNIKIGLEAPSMQSVTGTNFCNGYSCTTRFSFNHKGQHCSGDGLVYCESCLSYSTFMLYSKEHASTCRECFEIITDHKDKALAIERQSIKRKRIKRNGLIQGWLTVSKLPTTVNKCPETSQRMYCVLSYDCSIYTYELPEDKFHQLPIRLIRSTFNNNKDFKSSLNVTTFKRNGEKYVITADKQEEAIKWIQLIKFCQLENLPIP